MSTEYKEITKESLNMYLNDLAKAYKKLNRKGLPVEIILIGGTAILAGYNFRNASTDADALIGADSAIKDAITSVAEKHGLKSNWLNDDFKRIDSYSDKLRGVSKFYKTFAQILNVRLVSDEYLVAMKLKSGREYKFDLSDVVGILEEHLVNGKPISREMVNNALIELYGDCERIPESSKELFELVFSGKSLKGLYKSLRAKEIENNKLLKDFKEDNPKALTKDNISEVLKRLQEDVSRA